jgi:hypothetical protein
MVLLPRAERATAVPPNTMHLMTKATIHIAARVARCCDRARSLQLVYTADRGTRRMPFAWILSGVKSPRLGACQGLFGLGHRHASHDLGDLIFVNPLPSGYRPRAVLPQAGTAAQPCGGVFVRSRTAPLTPCIENLRPRWLLPRPDMGLDRGGEFLNLLVRKPLRISHADSAISMLSA